MKIDWVKTLGAVLLLASFGLGTHMVLTNHDHARAWYFVAGFTLLGALAFMPKAAERLAALVLPWVKRP